MTPITAPGFCEATGSVFKSGVYQKSYCVDSHISTYADAKMNCEDNGMRLFAVDSNEARFVILSYANAVLIANKDVVIYVSGQTTAGCSTINNLGGVFEEASKDCSMVVQSICEFSEDFKAF